MCSHMGMKANPISRLKSRKIETSSSIEKMLRRLPSSLRSSVNAEGLKSASFSVATLLGVDAILLATQGNNFTNVDRMKSRSHFLASSSFADWLHHQRTVTSCQIDTYIQVLCLSTECRITVRNQA